MRIAIDLDGVTINTIEAWIQQYHPYATKEDVTGWNVWQLNGFHCTKEQFFRELDNLDPNMVTVDKETKKYIKLLEKKYEVYFLTSKTPKMMEWTMKVLEREGLDYIPIVNSWGKGKNEYDYNILLDDAPPNVFDRTILFDQPWNRNVIADKRVYSWKEFYQMVR